MYIYESKDLEHYFVSLTCKKTESKAAGGKDTESKTAESKKAETSKTEKVINNTLKYYVSQAIFYKTIFITLSVTLLLINCSIPLINQLGLVDVSIWITLLSSVAAFVTGLISFIDFRSKWFRYRLDAENLKTECNLFNCGYGRYASLDDPERERLLVERFEEINGKDISMWEKELTELSKRSESNEKKSNKEGLPM